MWELEYKEKEFSIKAREAKGLPPPDWVENEPLLYPGDDFYLNAFYQLNSCRTFDGATPGQIPWDKIVLYADRHGLEPDVSKLFEHVLSDMDSAYLEWYAKRQKALISKAPNGRLQRKN